MMKRFLYFASCIFVFSHFFAQDFGIEMWKDHLPYGNVTHVVKDGSLCFGATPYGLVRYDEEDNSLERLTKINGLNDFDVSSLGYNPANKTVIVGYQNGNLDLIKSGKIRNLNAILVSNLLGDKRINAIHSDGDLSYLACGFGIVVIDTKKTEVRDTYIFGPGGTPMSITDITTTASSIICTTPNGIFKADKNNNFLADFNQWSRVVNISNPLDEYGTILYHNNQLWVVQENFGYANDSLFVYDDNFNRLTTFFGDDYFGLEPKDDHIIVCRNLNFGVYNSSFEEVENVYTYAGSTTAQPNHCIWDGTNFWVGDRNYSLNKSASNWSTTHLGIAGPHNNNCFNLSSQRNRLWVAAGNVDGSAWNNTYNSNGFSSFDGSNWKKQDRFTIPQLAGDSVFDFTSICIDPRNENHIFACSFFAGVFEFENNVFKNHYSYYNSSLQVSLVHGNNQVKVAAGTYDKSGNVWLVNSYCNNPLTVITPEGESLSFSCGSAANNTLLNTVLFVEQTGHLWLSVRGKGIIVYDFNNTPLDPSDDNYILLNNNESAGNLPSINVNDIVLDKDDEVWIGTEKGPAVFYNTGRLFEDGISAQRILLEQDGGFFYLLEEQNVTSIVIDGADRKWFGTSSGGLFLMSSDGTKQLYSFTTDNSPIYSNTVLSIAMNHQTGELFVGTDRGIIGFKGTATEAKQTFDDIYAFPNPVRPEYEGPIAIRGLMDKSDVKITDANGQLVFATVSNGGQAVWSGRDLTGSKVVSGVYYVFVVSQDGSRKSSTKVLIIR
jgi:hypothetical protein